MWVTAVLGTTSPERRGLRPSGLAPPRSAAALLLVALLLLVVALPNGEGAPVRAERSDPAGPSPTAALAIVVTATPTATDPSSNVTLHANVTGGTPPYRIAWQLDDGEIATEAWVNASFDLPGTYNVTAWANDSADASVNASVEVVVNQPPAVGMILDRSPTDLGVPVNLTAVSQGGTGPFRISWTFGDGGVGEGPTVFHTYATTGRFHVWVFENDSRGGEVASTEVVQVDPDLHAASLTVSPAFIDLGEVSTVTTSVLNGSVPYSYTYLGLPQGCPAYDESTLPCQPTGPGVYPLEVNISDGPGASVVAFANLTVVLGPQIVSFASAPVNGTVGRTSTLTVTTTGGVGPLTYGYRGLPPGCSTADASILVCIPTVAGNYTVRVFLNDSQGYPANATLWLNVSAAPASGGGTGPPNMGSAPVVSNPGSPPWYRSASFWGTFDAAAGVLFAAVLVLAALLWKRGGAAQRGGPPSHGGVEEPIDAPLD